MRLWPKSLKWRTILLTLLGLSAVIGTVGYVWWWPIRRYVSNQLQIIRERDDAHPVTRGLARREIRAGSSVEELEALHPPSRTFQHGRFRKVIYVGGPTVTAMDGKLVYAVNGWCSHSTVFFYVLTPEETAEYSASMDQYYAEQHEEWRCRNSALCGVAGLMPHYHPFDKLAVPPRYPEEPWQADEADPHRSVGGVIAFMPYYSPFRELARGEPERP